MSIHAAGRVPCIREQGECVSGELEVKSLSEEDNHYSVPAHSLHLPHRMAGPRNAKKNIWCVVDFAMHCPISLQEMKCCPSCRKCCQQMAFSCQPLQALLRLQSCLFQCHAPSWDGPCQMIDQVRDARPSHANLEQL